MYLYGRTVRVGPTHRTSGAKAGCGDRGLTNPMITDDHAAKGLTLLQQAALSQIPLAARVSLFS